MGAVFVYQLALLYRFEQCLQVWGEAVLALVAGVKIFHFGAPLVATPDYCRGIPGVFQPACVRQDIQRDTAWLGSKELSDVTATREQTLSGQWVTVVRFSYKPPNSNEAPRKGELRVKTDKWWLLTYVRTVEVVGL